ncbi:MAG: 2Fe-2S iron-sulfur cluster-binding protein, partial [Pseudomonadota bacterium]
MAIRFLLNGDPVEITDLPGTTTLLNWLRYERGLTGTKEGCAEGDCGACTVALRTAAHEGLDIKPVCACIQTLGMVHGREVITVEGISAQDGRLHPVQQALADGHGSQCGFCTPGFVMSLWSSYQSGKRPDRAQTCDALAGNLCRCTGYGPIINAASTAFDLPSPDWQDADATAHARLQNLNAGALIHEAMGRKFWAPETLSELAGLVADHPEATILSGATDIGLWITKHNFDPAEVIYTGRVAEFAAISLSENHLTIGAGATYRDAMVVLSRR